MYLTISRRRLWAGVVAALVLVSGVVGLSLSKSQPATPTGSWGLSFQAEGQPPVGNATPEELAGWNTHYLGDTTQKVIYLTFDAGYENGHTATILDTLKRQEVPACFFVVGHYLESAPDLVRRMVAEGHLVANHTDTHPNMAGIGDKTAFRRELAGVEEKYRRVTGQEMPKLYRPPQGVYSRENLQMAKEMGYHTFFWSLAYVDWYVDDQPTREQALEKLVGRIHPGAIVLLHSTSATNAAVLEEVIVKWKELGYSFAPLTALCS